MRALFCFLFILLMSGQAFAVAESQPKGDQKNSQEKKTKTIDFAQVNSRLSEAFCQKMDQCASQKMPQGQCISEMKDTFQQSYNALPKDQKLEVPSSDLDLCLKSIKDSSCDQLKSTQDLKGCEFIKKLN